MEGCTYGEVVLLGDVEPAVIIEVELVGVVAVVGHGGRLHGGAPREGWLDGGSGENIWRRVGGWQAGSGAAYDAVTVIPRRATRENTCGGLDGG